VGQFYNGFIFGNLPGLYMKQEEKVRWYLLGMGNGEAGALTQYRETRRIRMFQPCLHCRSK
jgi:hypothetical protein